MIYIKPDPAMLPCSLIGQVKYVVNNKIRTYYGHVDTGNYSIYLTRIDIGVMKNEILSIKTGKYGLGKTGGKFI